MSVAVTRVTVTFVYQSVPTFNRKSLVCENADGARNTINAARNLSCMATLCRARGRLASRKIPGMIAANCFSKENVVGRLTPCAPPGSRRKRLHVATLQLQQFQPAQRQREHVLDQRDDFILARQYHLLRSRERDPQWIVEHVDAGSGDRDVGGCAGDPCHAGTPDGLPRGDEVQTCGQSD